MARGDEANASPSPPPHALLLGAASARAAVARRAALPCVHDGSAAPCAELHAGGSCACSSGVGTGMGPRASCARAPSVLLSEARSDARVAAGGGADGADCAAEACAPQAAASAVVWQRERARSGEGASSSASAAHRLFCDACAPGERLQPGRGAETAALGAWTAWRHPRARSSDGSEAEEEEAAAEDSEEGPSDDDAAATSSSSDASLRAARRAPCAAPHSASDASSSSSDDDDDDEGTQHTHAAAHTRSTHAHARTHARTCHHFLALLC
jgi:hypothetical protein